MRLHSAGQSWAGRRGRFEHSVCLQADLVAQVRLEIEGGRLGLGAAFNSFSGHKLEESLSGRNMRCF